MRKLLLASAAASTLGLFLLAHPSRGAPVPPQNCKDLAFWAVQPAPNPNPFKKPCNKRLDKSACTIEEAYARMLPTPDLSGRLAYSLDQAEENESELVKPYLDLLTRSPAIQEINRMRIEARELAGYSYVCEPNLIYLGKKKLFGLGPVFVDSTRFVLGSATYSNFISAEDATFAGVSLLSKDSLIKNNYFDIVVAHELAHALTQDLYGLDAFAKIFKKSVSRDGHMASAVTDPTIALIEGVAEGYEAYFGEKLHGRHHIYPTPTLTQMLLQSNTAADFFQERGYQGYIFGALPFVVKQFTSTLFNMPAFTSEFLISERQETIRENHFVLQGSMSNLAHQFELIPGMVSDPELDALVGYEIENYDALFSKEGVIAHLIYKLLKAGLHRELFEILTHTKPQNSYELVTSILRNLPPAQLAPLLPALKSTFTEPGRRAVREYVRAAVRWRRAEITTPAYQAAKSELSRQLSRISMPSSLPAPRELWIEFQTPSRVRSKLYGKMDRINIYTATPDRLLSFITATQKPELRKNFHREQLLKILMNTRIRGSGDRATLTRSLRDQISFQDAQKAQMLSALISGINQGAECFQKRCLSLQ